MMLRDACPGDFPVILRLNEESVHYLSPLRRARLEALHAASAWHRVAEVDGSIVAFLLAFREGANYDSPNYLWFCRHYPQFLYIDRVVVSAAVRGAGLGQALYRDAIAHMREAGIRLLCCEYDLEPPNPGSARFHAQFGFREIGRQWVADGKKQVSLQVLQFAAEGERT